MRYILFLFPLLLLGCETVKLSPDARSVRVLQSAGALGCTHIGMVQSYQAAIVGGLSAAHVDLRNKVADAGGNAVAITTQQVDRHGNGTLLGDAYRCPTQGRSEPVVPSEVRL